MITVRFIRENRDYVIANLKRRREETSCIDLLLFKDKNLREITLQRQRFEQERNKLAKQNSKQDRIEAQNLKKNIQSIKEEQKKLEQEIEDIIYEIPNIIDDSVPDNHNKCVSLWGEVDPNKDFFSHEKVIESILGKNIQFISGQRFSLLTSNCSVLERALSQYCIDFNIQNSFNYCSVPFLCKERTLFGTGQLPKFRDDLYKIDSHDLWLIPTSEVILANLFLSTTVREDELPIRLTTLTPCFRAEAGASGKNTKGLIRQHQFMKCEIVSLVKEENGKKEHEFMCTCIENLIKSLEIPYRKVLLCAHDTGFSSSITYDFECWLPSHNDYVEVSSCSYCSSFQAIRMNTRYRKNEGRSLEYVHTLNGSALAIGRIFACFFENHFSPRKKGLYIPKKLRYYLPVNFSFDL